MAQIPAGKFDGVPTEALGLGEAGVPRPLPTQPAASRSGKRHCPHCGTSVATVAMASGRVYEIHTISDWWGRRQCLRSGTLVPDDRPPA